ncbi:MAG TPA: isoamylase early set domain-containing protein [Gemmatimonadaceae bacterium]|nr:isoamylase early set domain-containing protein [Gemmatimonadaceae bacterium]
MVHDDDFDPFIAEIARELKAPVGIDARLDQRIMAAIEPAVIPITVHRASRSARPWYRRTVSFSVTQVAGLAAAAALVGVVSMQAMKRESSAPASVAAAPAGELALQPVAKVAADPEALVPMQFILVAPTASSVALVGDFSDWDATRYAMERVSDEGAWMITVPLRPGRYEYQFEIDGKQRITDPTRPQTSSDFGSANSVVTVETRD